MNVKNVMSIPRPLERESTPITTRPGLSILPTAFYAANYAGLNEPKLETHIMNSVTRLGCTIATSQPLRLGWTLPLSMAKRLLFFWTTLVRSKGFPIFSVHKAPKGRKGAKYVKHFCKKKQRRRRRQRPSYFIRRSSVWPFSRSWRCPSHP